VSLAAAAILSGNSAVVIASEKFPLPALTFAEVLATSDVPGGVINILAGKRAELLAHIASHMDINAIVDASGSTELQGGTAINLKRYAARSFSAQEWLSGAGADPYMILDTVEFKTAWHPIGL
jgi:acyl-CoA reductase-like NAD-dependent aldehyde dehydrogenase